MTVPMLDFHDELATAHGRAYSHRHGASRAALNVLAHVVNVPYETILADSRAAAKRHARKRRATAGTGDVKYHHGAEGVDHTAVGVDMAVKLSPNPSHLESVIRWSKPPLVRTRRMDQPGNETDIDVALPVCCMVTPRSPGQGVVAETFNLARLRVHDRRHASRILKTRSVSRPTRVKALTDYSSDLAKGFDVPIIHVNADDPEACLAAVRLATMYREKFHGDVVSIWWASPLRPQRSRRASLHAADDDEPFRRPAVRRNLSRPAGLVIAEHRRLACRLARRLRCGRSAIAHQIDHGRPRGIFRRYIVASRTAAGTLRDHPR